MEMLPALIASMISVMAALVWTVTRWFQTRRVLTHTSEELTRAREALARSIETGNRLEAELTAARERLEQARPYLDVADTAAEAARIRAAAESDAERIREAALDVERDAKAQADRIRASAETEAEVIRRDSRDKARERLEAAEKQSAAAADHAHRIVQDAKVNAEQIAGDAYRALREAEDLERVAEAMRNKIEGYGDRYLVPTYSLLDELADAYGFAEAGQQLKLARERSQAMVEQGRAATCEYVEANRRDTAIRFVVDAFNGKVDTILSRAKADNVGTLRQQIQDAFALVNYNGRAFREARITEDYLNARLDELKWAAAAIALRDQEREEQRRIKAQIREEERARREFERAKREAEREEAAVRKAMARMQELVAKARDEQRAKYEAELATLSERLAEAEAKGQRALSMAQQTKSGHVYVISNVGSFGENVYKIGMTRRLEPLERIRELGDASVPFAFDVHAMIYAEDAPRLERELHRRFLVSQINKVNPRKEFFRTAITELKAAIEELGLKCAWTLTAEAAEYRESLAIEERISSDPQAREQWLTHQSLLDPVIMDEAEEDVETV